MYQLKPFKHYIYYRNNQLEDMKQSVNFRDLQWINIVLPHYGQSIPISISHCLYQKSTGIECIIFLRFCTKHYTELFSYKTKYFPHFSIEHVNYHPQIKTLQNKKRAHKTLYLQNQTYPVII